VEKILQIAGAPGWGAVFCYRNEDTGEMELETLPVALWALVEEHGEQYISGYNAADYFAEPASKDPHFVGYLAEGEDAEEKYREEAEKHLRWLEDHEARRRA
jgi:hypothetical protein